MKWKKENNVTKLTGPGGCDDADREGDSPGEAADSGVASGDECPAAGGRDRHQPLYHHHHHHQSSDRHEKMPPTGSSARCPAAFNAADSSVPRWMAFPGLSDI